MNQKLLFLAKGRRKEARRWIEKERSRSLDRTWEKGKRSRIWKTQFSKLGKTRGKTSRGGSQRASKARFYWSRKWYISTFFTVEVQSTTGWSQTDWKYEKRTADHLIARTNQCHCANNPSSLNQASKTRPFTTFDTKEVCKNMLLDIFLDACHSVSGVMSRLVGRIAKSASQSSTHEQSQIIYSSDLIICTSNQ